MRPLARLLKPSSVAVFGGAWAGNVIQQLQKSGYRGEIWPVHPSREQISEVPCFPNFASLPASPDAAFIGVNRQQTIEIVRELSAAGAGGAVCFASGFRETGETLRLPETGDTTDLQDQLVEAAGDMPLLGPNCYGYLNYLDNICLWPDQHGGHPVARGVAIIAQSSNIAINMTMQRRGLSLACLVTAGNQAQTGVSDLAQVLLADDRVSAIGLYLEGFGDIRALEDLAYRARLAAKPIVAMKIGKSEKAQAATLTHTASLAGSGAAASALLRRLGIVEVDSVSIFLETLKLLDGIGPLQGPRLSSVSCSGGEASLIADLSIGSGIEFADFSQSQLEQLGAVLGGKVTLANPLDYHTYIWGDVPAMTACFSAVMSGDFDLNVFVLDIPREDVCDPAGHDCAIQAIIAAKFKTAANVAVLSILPENLSEAVSERLLAAGVIPLHGMETGLAAIDAAIRAGSLLRGSVAVPLLLARHRPDLRQPHGPGLGTYVLCESEAKAELQNFGLMIPQSSRVDARDDIAAAGRDHNFPLVLKGLGIAHKTEAGAVILNIDTLQALGIAIKNIPECEQGYLIEEMVTDIIGELIIGVTRDRSGVFLLTLGAGGVLTELLSDTASILLPASREEIHAALKSLKIYKLMQGFRGQSAVNIEAVLDAIAAVGQYVEVKLENLEELDINPLAMGSEHAIAVDALIRLRN